MLTFGDAPEPDVAADMVLIRVELASIEAIDLVKLALYQSGLAEIPPSGIAGSQACGIVIATGAKVTRFRIGDRVVACHGWGSHAELFAAPEASTWPLPQGIDPGFGTAAPFTLAAAQGTLFARGQLQPGEVLLINHITSSLGIVALQLAAETGATVIGISRDPARGSRLRELGLHHALYPEQDDVMAACLELTGGKGVDFVFDVSAGERSTQLARLVAPGGRYAAISAAGNGLASIGYGKEGAGGPTIRRFAIAPAGPLGEPDIHDEVTRLLARVSQGGIQLPIEHEFALCEAAEAYEFILSGQPFGHVVMRP
ncbi:quinone oxidoreductase family protein [Novosphingobium lindaniclasticum]